MIASLRNMLRPRKAPPLQPAAVPAGQRVYAIGDIHGRADLFGALIDAIEADDAERGPPLGSRALPPGATDAGTLVILLGDLIDRGPDSAGVLAMARAWQDKRRVRIIGGNHEEMLLRALDDMEVLRHLLRFGGRETVISFGMAPEDYDQAQYEDVQALLREAVTPELRAYIGDFEEQIRVGDYVFVHAGIQPGVSLEDQHPHDLRWIREPFLSSTEDHGAIIVHGHTIVEEPLIAANRIAVDTGAYSSGRLTAIGFEATARWQITAGEDDEGTIAITRRPLM